jgi:hypothetical protein
MMTIIITTTMITMTGLIVPSGRIVPTGPMEQLSDLQPDPDYRVAAWGVPPCREAVALVAAAVAVVAVVVAVAARFAVV